MISKLSAYLTSKLLSNGTISVEDKELYVYGLFMLISHLMFLIITCIFGFVLKCPFESIIFFIVFMLIRRYAGGYHATTETRCEILTTLSILACVVVIKISRIYDIQTVILLITTLSAVCIFILCPLDTPEKPLSDKEFKYFRKVSWLILLAIVIAVIVSLVFKFQMVTVPCCISLILESILLAAGKINRVSQKKNAKT